MQRENDCYHNCSEKIKSLIIIELRFMKITIFVIFVTQIFVQMLGQITHIVYCQYFHLKLIKKIKILKTPNYVKLNL